MMHPENLLRQIENEPYRVLAEACRRNFFFFVKEFWEIIIDEEPVWNWHIPFLCKEFEKLLWPVIARLPKPYDLVINISPGTTKTTIASIMFPAWAWIARLPAGYDEKAEHLARKRAQRLYLDDPRPGGSNLRFITGSYALDIALKNSAFSRDIIKSDKYNLYFPEIALRSDQDAKTDYANTQRGSRFSTSVGAKVTGVHAHIIGIDDPIDPEQALSDPDRIRANEFIDNIRTRTVEKRVTPIYLIMQRLHEEDPTNKLLKGAKKVRHIRLPGDDSWTIAPDELRREYEKNDGLFDPVRMSREILEDLRFILGPNKYGGQIGQDPKPREGGMFQKKWFEIVEAAPEGGFMARGWDFAGTKVTGKAKSLQAATVGVLVKLVGARVREGKLVSGTVYIMDEAHGYTTGAETRKMMRACASQDGVECIQDIPQDPGQAGKDQVTNMVANLHGFVTKFSVESGDKAVRAEPLSAQCEVGNVKLVKGIWNSEWLEEVTFFPNGRKDRVDATVRAYNRVVRMAIAASTQIAVGGPEGIENERAFVPERG